MEQATELFFRVTKLFQCKDVYLRRLTYLLIKELANSSDTVIIVTNCLQQDINRTDMEMFRANAMRVLCRIIDGAMLGQIGALRAARPPSQLSRLHPCVHLTLLACGRLQSASSSRPSQTTAPRWLPRA